MIAGIEGIHAWTPPGGGPGVELGRVKSDLADEVWPRYVLRRITGLRSLGEPEANADRPPGREGELPRLSQRRGKSVSYEGAIQARSLLQLRQAEDALTEAFAEGNLEGRMDVSWHPALTEFADELPKFYEARALTCDIVETQENGRYERPFVIGLRLGDPRYFIEESGVHTVAIAKTNTAVTW